MFRTYEPERDRLVAVKAFRLDLTPEQANALADELSRAAEAGLFHPSIVEPITAGVEGSIAYAAEEYVAAESLDVAMRHYAPARLDTVLPFITQLAGAIDFARAAGIGHGGLHPRDIFVTPEEARATGFGVVEALERIGIRAPVRRPYSPPERIAGAAWGTPADVFSLAAITYELLTGRRPSGLGRELGPIGKGTSGPVPDAVYEVLVRAMDEDPSARFQTGLAFASTLESAARGEGPGDVVSSAGTVAASEPESDETPEVAEDVTEPEPPRATTLGEDDEDVESPRLAFAAAGAADRAPEPDEPLDDPLEDEDEFEELEEEEKDVVAERADGQSHHQLALHDCEAAEEGKRGEPGETGEDDDRFMLGVAGAAAAGDVVDTMWPSAPRDEAGSPPEEPTFPEMALREPDDSRERESSPPAAYPAITSITDAGAEQAPPSRWPLALMLAIGLALGFAAGYSFGGRSQGVTARSDPSGTSGTAPSREYSEQVVTPPPSAGRSTSASAPPTPPSATPLAEEPAPTPPRAERADAGTPAAAAGETGTARPTVGTLVIRSNPSNAGVVIDGTWRGRTPLTLGDLPLGRYRVRVVQPGYAPASETVTLTADDPSRTVSVRLRQQAAPRAENRTAPPATASPAKYTGSIYVDSRPRGAVVSLNGTRMGVTPLRIPEVRIGSHVVRLELPDHRIWSTSTRVTAGQESRVTGSLERIQ